MEDHQQLSNVAGLVADPTRAELLLILMDGRAFPVSELAAMTHVSTPTVSHHLSKLIEGGLVTVVQQGRHRYHRLAGPQVAQLIEGFGSAFVAPPRELVGARKVLQAGRSCYNHLAGLIGVQVRESLESRGLVEIAGAEFAVTSAGASCLSALGVDSGLTGKVCIDWTERVPHIGGRLGSALFDALLEKDWVRRGETPRQVLLANAEAFAEVFPLA